MRAMLRRGNRVVGSAPIGHVMRSASFFASTRPVAIGALLGVPLGLDRLQPAIDGLSIGFAVSRQFKSARAVEEAEHGAGNGPPQL